jgi:superkiller protein 3
MIGRVSSFVPLVCALGLWAGLSAMPAVAATEATMADATPAGMALDAETLWKQGLEAAQAGALDKAVGLFKQSLDVDPHGRAVMVDLATTLTDLERWDDARRTYERAVNLYPDDAVALNGLGYVHYRQARFDDAIACYRRALARMEDPQFHLNLGLALLSQERYGMAEDQFRRTLELNPDHYWARNNLGYALFLQGRLGEANSAYWEAMRVAEAGVVTTHLNLGQLILDDEEWEEAAWVYHEALKRNDMAGEAHVGLAIALMRMDRLAEARREAMLGVQLDAKSGAAASVYAEALARTGDWGPAIEAQRRAVALAPQNPRYPLMLARMLEWKERYPEAIAAYRSFLSLAPGHAEAADARMRLRLLLER